jgi:hypothetical protein
VEPFTGSTIGSYLGLVPTESSSGARRAQEGISKTGNSHARCLLVESAWHHRKPYRPSRELIRRRNANHPRSETLPSGATVACTDAGHAGTPAGNAPRSGWPRSPASWTWALAVTDSAVMDSAVMNS